MNGLPVELDDQPLLPPEAIRGEEPSADGDVCVQLRSRQPVAVDERHEALLRVALGHPAIRSTLLQQSAQDRRSPSPRIPREQVRNRQPIGQPLHFDLIENPLDLPPRHDSSEIEDRPRHR